MFNRKSIKSILFRAVAFLLLIVSVAMLSASESNTYSQSKIYIKSPAPQSGSYISTSVDDIKDADEDGALDFHVLPCSPISTFIAFPLKSKTITFGKPKINHFNDKIFIEFSQLLI
ncbi:MAG: hypothetical protein QM734_09235 [Cyclobacteriaceae bacterium]